MTLREFYLERRRAEILGNYGGGTSGFDAVLVLQGSYKSCRVRIASLLR